MQLGQQTPTLNFPPFQALRANVILLYTLDWYIEFDINTHLIASVNMVKFKTRE
jgi:hypothetical protein